jgi:hypothetical protein
MHEKGTVEGVGLTTLGLATAFGIHCRRSEFTDPFGKPQSKLGIMYSRGSPYARGWASVI